MPHQWNSYYRSYWSFQTLGDGRVGFCDTSSGERPAATNLPAAMTPQPWLPFESSPSHSFFCFWKLRPEVWKLKLVFKKCVLCESCLPFFQWKIKMGLELLVVSLSLREVSFIWIPNQLYLYRHGRNRTSEDQELGNHSFASLHNHWRTQPSLLVTCWLSLIN